MKKIILIACSLLISCQNNTSTTELNTIEDISDYIFKKKFPELEKDTLLNKKFLIKKSVSEYEGVEWDAFDFYTGTKLMFSVENNWESKIRVDRITFSGDAIKTRHQIYAGAPFGLTKPWVDSLKLNNSPDGELSFSDRQTPCMSYVFEGIPESSKLYYGVGHPKDVPDSLKIDAIVMQNCDVNKL